MASVGGRRKERLYGPATTKQQELGRPHLGALSCGQGVIVNPTKNQKTRFVFYCGFQSVRGLRDRVLARESDQAALSDGARCDERGECESNEKLLHS
jgi:hypothetical protein